MDSIISDKLDLIINRIDDLDRRLGEVERNVSRMDSHIDFVENVYDTVKYPFHSVMNMISGESTDQQKLLEERERTRQNIELIEFNDKTQ